MNKPIKTKKKIMNFANPGCSECFCNFFPRALSSKQDRGYIKMNNVGDKIR